MTKTKASLLLERSLSDSTRAVEQFVEFGLPEIGVGRRG